MNGTPNMNGDTAQTLYDQSRGVYEAAEALLAAMARAMPHGRNYQTIGGDAAWLRDRQAAMDRMREIETVRDLAGEQATRLADYLH